MGSGWADPDFVIPVHGFQQDGLACFGPCVINCTNNNEVYAFHPSGANAVFLDGHVSFMQDSEYINVYVSQVTSAAAD